MRQLKALILKDFNYFSSFNLRRLKNFKLLLKNSANILLSLLGIAYFIIIILTVLKPYEIDNKLSLFKGLETYYIMSFLMILGYFVLIFISRMFYSNNSKDERIIARLPITSTNYLLANLISLVISFAITVFPVSIISYFILFQKSGFLFENIYFLLIHSIITFAFIFLLAATIILLRSLISPLLLKYPKISGIIQVVFSLTIIIVIYAVIYLGDFIDWSFLGVFDSTINFLVSLLSKIINSDLIVSSLFAIGLILIYSVLTFVLFKFSVKLIDKRNNYDRIETIQKTNNKAKSIFTLSDKKRSVRSYIYFISLKKLIAQLMLLFNFIITPIVLTIVFCFISARNVLSNPEISLVESILNLKSRFLVLFNNNLLIGIPGMILGFYCLAIFFNMSSYAIIYITGETNNMWRYQTLPIKEKDFFNAKYLISLTLNAIPLILVTIVTLFLLGNPLYVLLALISYILGHSLSFCVIGLLDTLKPALDTSDLIKYVKSGKNAYFSVFIVLLALGIIFAINVLLPASDIGRNYNLPIHINLWLSLFILIVINIISYLIEMKILKKRFSSY